MIKATAKDEIQVVLQEYLGNRKAAKVAETVYAVIQKETQHTRQTELAIRCMPEKYTFWRLVTYGEYRFSQNGQLRRIR